MKWDVPNIYNTPVLQIKEVAASNNTYKGKKLEDVEKLIHTTSKYLQVVGSQELYIKSVNLYWYI